MQSAIDPDHAGLKYLTEGGTETEILYRYGFEFPEFAVFELLKNPEAMVRLREMYRAYFDVVVESGMGAMVSGLDYRASPDWATKLGYSQEGLREVQDQCIDFLKEAARPYAGQVPDIKIVGILGPRGDAYQLNKTITAEEAEDYHSVQLETLKALGVDLAHAATFNNVPEAVGAARAAHKVGIPICISFTLTSEHRLRSGPSLREAVEDTDRICGAMKPMSYGINCSHPKEFEPALEPGDWFARIRNIRPNAAAMDKIALCKLNHLEEGDPVELGEQLGALSRAHPHIDMWGGCCGTWDKHLREIARQVKYPRSTAL